MHGAYSQRKRGFSADMSYHPQQAFDILNYYHPSLMQRQRRSWKNKPAPKAAVSPPRPHSDHFLFAQDDLASCSIVFPPSKHPSPPMIRLCDIKSSPPISSQVPPDPLVTTSKTPLNASTCRIQNNKHGRGDGNRDKAQQQSVDFGTPPKITPYQQQHSKGSSQQQRQQQDTHTQDHQQQQYLSSSTQVIASSVPPYRIYSSGQRRFPLPENLDQYPYYHANYIQQHYPPPYYLQVTPYDVTYHPHYYQQQQYRHQYPVMMYDGQYHPIDKGNENQQRRISTSNTTNSSTRSSSSSSGLTLQRHRRFSSGSSGSSCKSTVASSMESTFADSHDPAQISVKPGVISIPDEEGAMDPTPLVVAQDEQHQQQHQQQQQQHVCDDTQVDTDEDLVVSSSSSSSSSSTGTATNNGNESTTDETAKVQYQSAAPAHASEAIPSTVSSTPALPIWADPVKIRENPTRYKVIQDYMAQHSISYTSSLPLNRGIVFYCSGGGGDTKSTTTNDYRSSMHTLFTCQTVWEFSSRWRLCKEQAPGYCKPSHMPLNQTLYSFCQGVEPMWEDKVNKHGGRMTVMLPSDELVDWLLCGFVGGNLVSMVGLVLSKRARGDRVELWLDATSNNPDTVLALRQRLLSFVPEKLHGPLLGATFKKHYK